MRLGETSCQLGNIISGFSGGEKINPFLRVFVIPTQLLKSKELKSAK